MNRKNSKKSTTPTKKKNTKKSSTTSKKKSNATPNKSPKTTPIKTRTLRSRTLPKSPISESMKQSKINDYFKPSQSIGSPFTSKAMSSNHSESDDIEFLSEKPIQRKTTKGPKVLAPIFGTQKRYSLRKSNENNSAKKLRFEDNQQQSESSEEHNSCANQLFATSVDISDKDSGNNSEEYLQKSFKINKRTKSKRMVSKSNCGQNFEQMMDDLEISEKHKSSKNSTNVLSSASDNRKTTKTSAKVVKDLPQEVGINLVEDEDKDLMPVFRPVFKIPEIPKQKTSKKGSKENISKYEDKEKDKKMNYFLKNLSRIKRDKQMLDIQPIEQMELFLSKDKTEKTIFREEFRIKSFEGIDVFIDFIPKTIEKYLSEQINRNSSNGLTLFSELPLNQFLPLLTIRYKRLKESELQQLLSQIINRISSEDNSFISTEIVFKIIEILSENDFEIFLSQILKDFYRILSQISSNLRSSNSSDSDPNYIKKGLKYLSNVMELMSHILSKSSYKIEAMDSVEEFIKLLIICFGLGLDYRLIQNEKLISDIKKLIAVLLNNIFVDESKAVPIVENLISFCDSEEQMDVMIALQIASYFPLNSDFELKRRFCISVLQLFAPKVLNEFQTNLNEILNIFGEIQWKSLSPKDFYVIIQMIGLSLDLPKDLIEHKQTIANIFGVLEKKVNASLPNETDYQFQDIHKSVMILRSKINVSTKRF